MLCAYVSGLKAYHEQSKGRVEKQGSKRPSFDGWDEALKSAEDALAIFRKAEGERQAGDVDSADTSVQEALRLLLKRYYFQSSARFIYHSLLCLSTGAVPTLYESDLIMTGWDDDEVRKA
jgi:hypothetical protein